MAIRCTTKILTILLLQYKRIIVTIRVVVVVVHGGGILLIILGVSDATASTANRVSGRKLMMSLGQLVKKIDDQTDP
jgi:hypothetical protein